MNDCKTSDAAESLCIITLMIPFLSKSKYLAKRNQMRNDNYTEPGILVKSYQFRNSS